MMPERQEAPRSHCIRCGTCCMKGGPTLHDEDATLLSLGILEKSHIYTLRKGETVRKIDENLMILDHEIIKIKGQGQAWTCMFYDDTESACRVYDHRPIECRALKCWDLREFRQAMARPRLKRRDLVSPDDGMLRIMDAHEQRCSYETLETAVKELGGVGADKAVQEILDLLQYDSHVRYYLAEKYNMDPGTMDFFFGRPLTTTIRMFGLYVREEGDTFRLVPVDSTGGNRT